MLGQLFGEAKKEVKSKDEDCKERLIERDRIIVCSATQFVIDNDNKKEIKNQHYRVLAVRTKTSKNITVQLE